MSASEQITKEEAAAIFGVTKRTFGERMRSGKAPRALPGTRRWLRSAVLCAARKELGAKQFEEKLDPFELWEKQYG